MTRDRGETVTNRLEDVLDRRDLAAVWFARPSNFAWLTGGDNVVDGDADHGVAAAGYDGHGVTVVTDDVEAERLAAEELPEDVPVESYPWHESSLSTAVAARSDRPAAADFAVEGFETLDASSLRQPLTGQQCDRYRQLGRETAAAVETVCRAMEPVTTEREAAADLRRALAARGIDAPVVLVGSADRACRYRHYTPTDATIGAYGLVSVTARRGGLYASCTRTVAFDPPEWLLDRHEAAARVEATALAATRRVGRDGGTAADVFDAVQRAYETVGWPGEWRNHHQGGAAGFSGREWIATPTATASVELPMAYAWNPTVQGAKSEDTVLVTADDFEVLTTTGDWPTFEVETAGGTESVDRPAVLVE